MERNDATDAMKDKPVIESDRDEIIDYFGLCPHCVDSGDYTTRYTYLECEHLNLLCCEKHSCFWHVDGYFPDPDRLSKASGLLFAKLATMTQVVPRLSAKTERSQAARNRRARLIAELGTHLSDHQQDVVIGQLCQMTGMDVDDDRLRHRDGYELSF